LIEKGAIVDIIHINSLNTPLHFSCIHNHLKICKLLIKKGADVNAQNKLYETPLYIASQHGYTKICKLLVYNNANVRYKNNRNGLTPLSVSFSQKHFSVLKILIENDRIV
jgi:ankyrin repeat protein